VRCGEPEIGVSDSAAEVRLRDGAAQEREKRGFAGGGERRLLRGRRAVPAVWSGRVADATTTPHEG